MVKRMLKARLSSVTHTVFYAIMRMYCDEIS